MEARVADELCLLPPVRNSPRIIEVLEVEGTTTYNIVCGKKKCFVRPTYSMMLCTFVLLFITCVISNIQNQYIIFYVFFKTAF